MALQKLKKRTNITLEIGGKKYPLQSFNIGFQRQVDDDGQPMTPNRCNLISFSYENDDDMTIIDWMTNVYDRKDFKIIQMEPDDPDKTLKSIEFKDAYVISYAESIPEGGYGTVEVSLTAKELTIKGDQEVGPIINEWVLAKDE